MYKCENNYLTNTENLKIFNVFNSDSFPWYYNSSNNIFIHSIVKKNKFISKFLDLLKPFIFKIKNEIEYADCIFLNKNSKSKAILENKNTFEENSFIKSFYCINTSNGHISINIKDEIPFVQNRFVLFDNQLSNKILLPTDTNQFILEIVYKK